MSLNIYPSKVGDTITLKTTYLNEFGEIVEGSITLNVSAPNLRTTENNDDHLFLRSTNGLFLCSTEPPTIWVGTNEFHNYYDAANFLRDNQGSSYYVLIQDSRVIPQGAFSGCENINSVVFLTPVKEIGNYAFSGCNGLFQFDFHTLSKIGDNAFASCRNLRSIHIPGSIKTISKEAFVGCVNATSIQIDEGVEYILASAFEACFEATELSLPNGLKTIGDNAFERLYALKSVVLPNTITSLGKEVFDDCESLENV